jgi:hypothetical protein
MQNGLFRFILKITKHAKLAFTRNHEISRNGQLVSRNNQTRFASSFAKQEEEVTLETLYTQYTLQKKNTSELLT